MVRILNVRSVLLTKLQGTKFSYLQFIINSLFPPPGNHHSSLWFCEFDGFRYLPTSRIMQYLSFCDWLIPLNRISSDFNYVVANCRISFFFNKSTYREVISHHASPLLLWGGQGILGFDTSQESKDLISTPSSLLTRWLTFDHPLWSLSVSFFFCRIKQLY